jgi:hypothetical protein
MLALDASIKTASTQLRDSLPPVFERRFWMFAPLVCVVVGTISLIGHEFAWWGRPETTAASKPVAGPQYMVQRSALELKSLTNEEIRTEVYSLSRSLSDQREAYINERGIIDRDWMADQHTKAKRQVENDQHLSAVFRDKYLAYCILLKEEMDHRLQGKSSFTDFVLGQASRNDGLITDDKISALGSVLVETAQRLR